VAEKTIWTYPHIPTRPSHLYRLAKKFPDYRLEIAERKTLAAYADFTSRADERAAFDMRPASNARVVEIRPF
jgi:hypothetical protein